MAIMGMRLHALVLLRGFGLSPARDAQLPGRLLGSHFLDLFLELLPDTGHGKEGSGLDFLESVYQRALESVRLRKCQLGVADDGEDEVNALGSRVGEREVAD